MAATDMVKHEDDSSIIAGDNFHSRQFVTMQVDGQLFGIPVQTVRDVLRPLPITDIPLSVPEIKGSINLRGRIVTVIDMRIRLGLDEVEATAETMHVVVEHKEELYSFVIDKVGDVLTLKLDDLEHNPANLGANWQQVSLGVYRLDGQILVVLDIESLLKL